MNERQLMAQAWREGAIAGFQASNDCGVNGSVMTDIDEIMDYLPKNPYKHETNMERGIIDVDTIADEVSELALKEQTVTIIKCPICGSEPEMQMSCAYEDSCWKIRFYNFRCPKGHIDGSTYHTADDAFKNYVQVINHMKKALRNASL